MLYADKDRIKIKLMSRLGTDQDNTYLGQQVLSEELLDICINENEGWIDDYLRMIYEMPLRHQHSILGMIADRLVIADVMLNYFEGSFRGVSGDPGFGAAMRQQGLDLLQSLFYGTGIIIPGASERFENIQGSTQLRVKFVPLPGEVVKPFIGLDQDNDGVPDHELWSTSPRLQSVYLGITDKKAESRTRLDPPIDFYFRDEKGYDFVD